MTTNTNLDLDVTSDLGGVYLKRADVEAGEQAFTITDVTRETFEARNGRPAQTKVVLTLAGTPPRKFGLVKTNLRTIKEAWGVLARAWIGRTIVVYLDRTVVNPSGGVPGGLRIRIPAAARPPAPSAPTPVTVAERRRQLEAELATLTPAAEPGIEPDDDISFAFGANTGEVR